VLAEACTLLPLNLVQASVINDLLDFEALKGASANGKASQLDVDATVHSVVRMFTNSVRSKVRFRYVDFACSAATSAHALRMGCDLRFANGFCPVDTGLVAGA
jgi:hypothetical protein